MGWKEQRQAKHFSLIRNIYKLYPQRMCELLGNLHVLTDELIVQIVEKLPDDIISSDQKGLVIQYTISRRDILIRIGENMKQTTHEMAMIWKDPVSRQRFVVGVLTEADGNYTFRYINPELDEAIQFGFQNYPSFPNLMETYVSEGSLFSSISNRLPRQKRPDYAQILEKYGVDPSSSEMEILKATRGRIPTDTFEFIHQIDYDPGTRFTVDFEIAGVRHYDFNLVLDSLKEGSKLKLVSEPNNPNDKFAVQIKTWNENVMIGFVPKYHSQAVTKMLEDVGDHYEAFITRIQVNTKITDEMIAMKVTIHV